MATSDGPADTEATGGIFQRLDQLNEFERDPVTADKLHGGSHFAAVFSGEHVAATEFVIGVLFVNLGAKAYDVLVGLLLGNLLAVLSWTLVCAPIAVQTRLTLYWYLRKIAGPVMTVLYNLLNAFLYCILAGAMITVSASAVRIPLNIGAQTRWYPEDFRFVLVVLGVGAVVVLLAILGFKSLARFASVCSPWMIVMFVAGGLATLPSLGSVGSLAGLWSVAEEQIWTGGDLQPPPPPAPPGAGPAMSPDAPADPGMMPGPAPDAPGPKDAAPKDSAPAEAPAGGAKDEAKPEGQSKEEAKPAPAAPDAKPGEPAKAAAGKERKGLGFWHIVAFAWVCNLAMHLGLSDMALFRFAKRPWYGVYSAFGMYLGHYLSWICAGIMGAAAVKMLGQPLTELDSGGIASAALGAMGAVTVVIAGWTTANPTLYRAGLALQVVTPGWPRWLVTLLAGTVTTLVACSPFVFTKLLDFVAIYGILLVPVGAIVVAEHWIFPRVGLTRFWSARRGSLVNWPALVSWLAAIAFAGTCWALQTFGGRVIVHMFFLVVPVWIGTTVLYIILAAVAGAARKDLPELPERDAAPAAPSAPVAQSAGISSSTTRIFWLTGAMAAACLALIVGFALAVFFHTMTLDDFKGHLPWLTLAYFAAAIVWAWLRGRRQAQAAE